MKKTEVSPTDADAPVKTDSNQRAKHPPLPENPLRLILVRYLNISLILLMLFSCVLVVLDQHEVPLDYLAIHRPLQVILFQF